MSFNVQNFRSNAFNIQGPSDLLRTDLFEVSVFGLPTLTTGTRGPAPAPSAAASQSEKLRFFCHQAILPTNYIQMQEIRRYGYGYPERKPMEYDHSFLALSIFADSRSINLELLTQWFQTVFNFEETDRRGSSVNEAFTYELGFKSDYARRIDVTLFSSVDNANPALVGTPLTRYSFYDAYPINITRSTLDWGTTQLLTIDVQFIFTNWNVELQASPPRSLLLTLDPKEVMFRREFAAAYAAGVTAIGSITGLLDQLADQFTPILSTFQSALNI